MLLDCCMAGDSIIAVGERGVILLSTDGGRRWRQAREVPVSVTLTAVQFPDARTGWATGHSGVVLRSSDGGDTWERVVDGQGLARVALAGIRAASGASGALLRAANAWVNEPPAKPLFDLHVFSPTRVVVVGAFGFAFETRDAGRTWSSWMQRVPNPNLLDLYAVHAVGETLYMAGDQGFVCACPDDGGSAEELKSPYAGSWFAIAGDHTTGPVLAGLQGNAWRYATDTRGWHSLTDSSSHASFVSATQDATGSLLLADQANQLFELKPGANALEVRGVVRAAPLTHAMTLRGGGILATTYRGAVLVAV